MTFSYWPKAKCPTKKRQKTRPSYGSNLVFPLEGEGETVQMWSFTANDLADGAQEKVVAASDFRGPKRAEDRRRTDSWCLGLLGIAIVFSGFCFVAPYYIGEPDYDKLLNGMSYNGAHMPPTLGGGASRAAPQL